MATAGTDLFIDDRGAGHPVVLLHGTPSSPQDFEPLVEALASRRRTLVPHAPGYGRTAPLAGPVTLPAAAAALERQLLARGLTNVDVVAFSGGAYAAVAGTVFDDDGSSSLTITGCALTQAGNSGGGVAFYGKTLSISGHTAINMIADGATANTNSGVGYHGTAGNPSTMSLTDVTITGGGTGILQDGADGSAKLRNTTVTMQALDGYEVNGGNVDLGKTGDPATIRWRCPRAEPRPRSRSSSSPRRP